MRPAPSDPHIGLVHTPRTGLESLILADPLLEFRRVALLPAKDGGWVDLNTTLLHHLDQITVADPVFAVPAHAQQDNLNQKATALEQKQQGGSSGSRPPYSAKVNATEPRRPA